MIKRRHGRIVGITSVVGVTGNPGQANYAAAKAGIIGMSKSLAQEVAQRGITVNCVAPGFIDTTMTDGLSDAVRESIVSRIPAGRLGSVGEVASAVGYLASDEAGYVTGQTLHVNGGHGDAVNRLSRRPRQLLQFWPIAQRGLYATRIRPSMRPKRQEAGFGVTREGTSALIFNRIPEAARS